MRKGIARRDDRTGILMCAPVVGMTFVAAVIDWRERRIPNWVTFSLILSGLAQSFTPHALASPANSLLASWPGSVDDRDVCDQALGGAT